MSYHDDYILRLIEKMCAFINEVIRRITGESEEQKIEKANELIEEGLKKYVGIGFDALNALSYETLEVLLDASKQTAACELLAFKASLLEDTHFKDEILPIREKALFLLLCAAKSSDFNSNVLLARAIELDNALPILPKHLYHMLCTYYEQCLYYTRCEDCFDRFYDHYPTSDVLALYKAFYLRLKALSDEELRLGGLTRQEVLAGAEWLSNK